MNYKTVASFGHESKLVRDYSILLRASQKTALKQSMLIGFSYGFSQFTMYTVIACIFYAGAEFLVNHNEAPLNMFICIFSMMFAALEIG